MLLSSTKFMFHVIKYYNEKVNIRNINIQKTIYEIVKIVSELLQDVESQEPRFVSSINEVNGRFEGITVHSPTEFEIVLLLNQMGVFNFVDDNVTPGCGVLKLSDGRKRSMSLWVEFITASGYLSARKIRSRFQSLFSQACERCSCKDIIKIVHDGSEVKLRIHDKYTVQIIPAFKCIGLWPRSASQWPHPQAVWPHTHLAAEIKADGFNLFSQETTTIKNKQSSSEGDAWVISFTDAENRLLFGGCRKKCFSILKTLRDKHFDLPGEPITNYVIKTLVLYECDKHPHEFDWDDVRMGDRMNGVLLQLISCLKCRKCPHYFLPSVDLFKHKSTRSLNAAAKQVWWLLRELILNPKCLERL